MKVLKVTRLTTKGSPPVRKGKALSPDSCCQAAEKRWAPAVRLSMPLKLRLSTCPALAEPLSRLSK
ncbi:hypothetical protein FQZ97_1135210 [compost metagenome]